MTAELNKYTYEEIEAFGKKIHDVMLEARKTGQYVMANEAILDDNVVYEWALGPTLPAYIANGKDAVMRNALGAEMAGVDGWKYPWGDYWVDPEKGVLIYNWKMISPWERSDGTFYAANGYGYSFHTYAGNGRTKHKTDICESQMLQYCHAEGVAGGFANEAMREKVKMRRTRETMALENWIEHLEELREEYGYKE